MRIASIDIGTNAVLLLISDIDINGNITVLDQKQHYPRLGRSINEKYIISDEAFESVRKVIEEYISIANSNNVEIISAVATSAVRDSSNKDTFINYIKKSTGLSIETISGIEEAKLTYKGVVNGSRFSNNQPIVLDIGGGSTEVSFYHNNDFISYSLQIGAVRLTEQYFKHNPPMDDEISEAIIAIQNKLDIIDRKKLPKTLLVGVAGTLTTLACIDQNLEEFDTKLVSGYTLTRDRIQFWFNKLKEMDSYQVRSLSNSTKGREDILTAGVLILKNFMEKYDFEQIIVSERGLRYGLALREWEKHKSNFQKFVYSKDR